MIAQTEHEQQVLQESINAMQYTIVSQVKEQG